MTAVKNAHEHLRRVLRFADDLPRAKLRSGDRQQLMRDLCWEWRLLMADLGSAYSKATWIPDDVAKGIWNDALAATERGYQPAEQAQRFGQYRRQLLAIGTARGFKREKKK